MRPNTNKMGVLAGLLLTVYKPVVSAQTELRGRDVDHFVGTWKLNPEKSSKGTGIVKEQIKIAMQETKYKLTYDTSLANGTELHSWIVTSMTGEAVTPTQANGQPMNGEERLVRVGPDSFKSESKMGRDAYQVSKDGKTLTLQRTLLGRSEKLTFDRQ